jgi:DNA-binding response OmpR family regulator
MNELEGKRILVVEDDFLISLMVTEILMGASAAVIGPARTKDAAFALASTQALDGAVLDINLDGERSDIVAAELQRRSIPFILATGYDKEAHDAPAGNSIVNKPFTEERLVGALTDMFERTH